MADAGIVQLFDQCLIAPSYQMTSFSFQVFYGWKKFGYSFSDPTERQETEALLNVLARLPIADAVVMKVVEIRQSRRMKLPDAIIAATALLNNCIDHIRNKRPQPRR